MRALTTTKVMQVLALVGLAALGGGCSINHVYYDRRQQKVANVWADDISERKETLPCYGSLEVIREHGFFHLIGPDGPWWQHRDYYSIFFKKPVDSSEDFYFTMDSWDNPAGKLSLKIADARGKVQIDGRLAYIDVEYRDSQGRWRRAPINGRRKINLVFPDDTAQFTPHPVK